MKYYQLNPKVLRKHLAATEYYLTDSMNSKYWTVVIGHDKKNPWALTERTNEPLDLQDCFKITADEYFLQFKKYQKIKKQNEKVTPD